MKRTVQYLGFILMICLLIVIDSTAYASKVPSKLIINKSKKTIYVKQTYQLKVKKVTPINASKKVNYKTSNIKVATVSQNGLIMGKKKGTARIIVTSKGNKKVKTFCNVIVKNFQKKKLSCKITHVTDLANILEYVYSEQKKYKVFTTYDQLQEFIKTAEKKYKFELDSEKKFKKRLKSYKSSFFDKKILCLMVQTVGSGSQKLTPKSLYQTQKANGDIVGELQVHFSKQLPDELWNDAEATHLFLVELNKKDADMIQSYKIKKIIQ